jgi:hypothetical protein
MPKLLRASLLTLLLITLWQLSFSQNLEARIRNLSGIVSVEKMESNPFFNDAMVIMVKQPLDHLHPERGTFLQRVILSNLGMDQPVVFVTEGYGADYGTESTYLNELCPLMNANQLIVEHRFFGKSVPDSIDWKYMTVENAAADQHHIVDLFKSIYGKKWISTGISYIPMMWKFLFLLWLRSIFQPKRNDMITLSVIKQELPLNGKKCANFRPGC